MPWQVVERPKGYRVMMAPALEGKPAKYFAQFDSSAVHRWAGDTTTAG
jgi:hypothetical protein